jgi:hypothetical protein
LQNRPTETAHRINKRTDTDPARAIVGPQNYYSAQAKLANY